MTDSVDRKKATPEQIAKLNELPTKRKQDRKELSDIPGWARVAIVYKELFDVSMKDTLELLRIDRAVSTFSQYRKSPAGKKLRKQIERFKEDPVAMAETLLRSSAMQITVDRLLFLEAAKASGNYKEADRIARDLQDRVPELAKKTGGAQAAQSGMVIQVQFSGSEKNLEPIRVTSSHSPVEEAEYEIEDD